MADSRDTAALRESERQAPRRILLLIPRATKEEEAERSGGVIHGVHTEDEVTERGDRENREKERRMETDTREMDRGNGKEEGEKEQGMDKEMREKRRKMEADDNVGESGESGEARHQRAQPQLGQRAFTLVGLNHQHLLLLETQRGAALSPSLGTLPPLTGRRGPGKQSSMAAYRLNPPEPPEPGQSQPGIVRGSIPVELRDWQKGGGWGTLIMGPDGDIIRLSLWDPTGQQQLSLDDVTEEHAVRILVSEGEEAGQSWTLLLKPEATVPGEDCLGKANVTSDNSEAYHSSMRRVTRVGVCVNEIKSEGRCGSATDNGAPVEGQVLLLTQSQTSSQPQTPERRGAASGDQPVITAHSTPLLTGEEAEKKPGARGRIAQHTGSDRIREMDRAGEDTLPDADRDSASPSVLRDDSLPSSHPTIPPVEAPSDPSIPQCLSGVDLEAMETHTKTAGATPSRKRERKTKGENKKGMKEGAGASKAPRAGGRRGGRAGVKGQDVFVVGKPRKKQEQKTGVEKSERKNPEEDEPLVEQKEEEEEQQAPGDDKIGHFGDTVERPISAEWGTASSSRSQHSDDSSAPVSRGQSSRQASLPGEALPSSPPPMSLHQLTSRSASTATDSYVMKPSQTEDSVHVNNSRTAEEVARQRERQAAARAEKAERRRQEVERKRREREEEKRRLLERKDGERDEERGEERA
ncbi:hypothetical protein AALO_G00037330 [Alosa alosa]|uniref:Uncharacterized protein n=1 Tax=Alosa alosa TaxID=278164 RepID=A0AAV6HC21_9TELE|nr:hypothetical protein AALO_G00037330 [Alosa alosa]